MSTCQYCQKKWTYMDTMENSGRSYMFCLYCKELNYQSEKSRKRDIIIGGIVPLPMIVLFITFNVSYQIILSTGILFLVVFILTYPLLLELTKEQEQR